MKPLLVLLASFAILHASQPNIILILADDLGYECITANGGESYQTPHLDRLAASGMRFEQCHSQPLCTPTRVQLMTGKSNVRNYYNFGTLMRTEQTFAQLLKQAGYVTGICGKWQLGNEKDSPRHFGFDEALLWQHTRMAPRYANPGLEFNGAEKEYPQGSYGPKLINDFALDFVTRHKDKPFFLYYPMILPHDPFQPTPDCPDWDPAFRGEGKTQHVKHFAGMVAYMDKMVGRLDAKLAELGIRDNTLLIFTGDNGTSSKITNRFKGMDFRGGKGSTKSNGHHVPLIASWPAVMKQGRVNRDLISCADFLPTFCEATGTPVPDDVDGVSFLPQLLGEPGTPRESIYTWYGPRKNNLTVHEFAFDQTHKLYRNGLLYDIEADPGERKPLKESLSDHQAAAKAKLQAALDRYKAARPAELDRRFKAEMKDRPNPAKKKNKPNVLMIFTDDHGWADTGYYGRKDVRTPNLDRLAASGIRFDNGYVTAPQCIPSRTGLALGRYQQRFGLECNPDDDKQQEFELPPGVTTIGDEMRRAGYRTGMAGKWHLGDKDGTQPYERGFDWCAYLRGGMGYHFLGRRPEELHKLVVPENWSPPMYQQFDSQPNQLNYRNAKNEIIPVGGVGYIPQLITDQALDFISQSDERPFFAYLSYHPPHWPNEALPETISSYAHIEDPHRRLACAMITDVDTQVGRLLDFLEEKNIARDTLVVFFSDNGAPAHSSKGGTLKVGENASTNGPLKGFKGNLWEGGIRVPFLMSWPGRFNAGSVVGWPVSTLDLTPTFLAAAGAPPMKDADGANLMPHLDGSVSADGPDRALFWRYHTAWCADSAVRRGPWKLVRQFSQKESAAGAPPTTELYHISQDQAEAHNVAATHPEIVASLKKELAEWEKSLAEPKWATVLKPPVLEK